MDYLTTLEKYKTKASRHTCPQCQRKHSLALYINVQTGEYISPIVGRCNRESNCGYHYKPKDYFQDNQINPGFALSAFSALSNEKVKRLNPAIPNSLLKQSLVDYDQSKFYQYLVKVFGLEMTNHLVKTYFIGTSNDCYRKETGYWEGATVFWFIDISGKIRAGQVKLFDDNGHTAKYTDQDGSITSCTDGIHTPLKWSYKKRGEELPDWLSNYVEGKKITCFFGEHLLRHTNKTIAVVEAPKTAIIASAYLPQFTWLAVGALSYLTEERCRVLAGRKVILYPDLSKREPGKLTTYEKWCAKAQELAHITSFKVSNLLEQKATEQERIQGLDLADFLIKIPFSAEAAEENKEEPEAQPSTEKEATVVNEPVRATMEDNTAPNEFRVVTSTQPESFSNWFESTTPEPVTWHQDILELLTFFSSVTIPARSVCLDACTTITNVPLFVQAHLETVQNNNGKRAFLPYLERLQQLKSILKQQPIN